MNRRNFLSHAAIAPFILSSPLRIHSADAIKPSSRIQYSVNAYSFNSLLRSREMTFVDMMEFAADIDLDAVDLTGYYFSSYPNPPDDEELFRLKLKALELGLNISWTGIRNDFVTADAKARENDREMIRQWLEVSSKLGASIMRVFAGTADPEGYSREQIKERMVEDFKICAGYAQKYGVLLGLQHHNNFLYHSEEIINMIEQVDSDWFGLILDTGSLHAEDPYDEIEKLAPYANYWFVKEHVYPSGEKKAINMKKLAEILKRREYRGYVSIESLSEGDPREIVSRMVHSLRSEMQKLQETQVL